jgi:transmembrane sensor
MRGWQSNPSDRYTLTLAGAMNPSSNIDDNRPPFSMHDHSDEAIAWFARLHSGALTSQERAQFESWRSQRPEHEQAFQEIESLWETPELIEAAMDMDQAAQSSDGSHATRRRWARTLAAAAALLLVVVAVAQQYELPLRLQADYVTATGEVHTMTLVDHSTVTLNTNSAVTATYGAHQRQLRLLKGEALFRVQPDKTRPFLVEHHGVVTRAVGTSFVVREREGKVLVSVIEGTVAVELVHQSAAPLQLTAGQQVVMEPTGPGSVQSINPHIALAWMEGRLVFEGTPFSEVLEEIARYHPGYVGLWNRDLAKLRVSGSYNLSNTSNVLTTLQQTLPVHMTRLTDRFVVFR